MDRPNFERRRDVLRRTGRGNSALYADINAGLFTAPIPFGKVSVWPEHEVSAIIAARIRGLCDDSIRMLVKGLMAQRKTIGLETENGGTQEAA